MAVGGDHDPFDLLNDALAMAGAQLPAAAAHNLQQARSALAAYRNPADSRERGPLVLVVGNCCFHNPHLKRLETYGSVCQPGRCAASHEVMQVGLLCQKGSHLGGDLLSVFLQSALLVDPNV